MSLVMLHLPVATRAVLAAGRGHRLVDGAWSVDTGYLLHALFARLFGNAAPKPFDIQESAGDMGETLPVLAYAAHDHRALATRASANGSDAVDWDRAGSKPMPAFAAGQALGFRVRVCPVLRVGKHHPRFAPGAEVDPYLALVQRRVAEAGSFATAEAERACKDAAMAELPTREAVYAEWLAVRFGAAAAIRTARIAAMRDARLWRKGVPQGDAARLMHGRERAQRNGRALIGRRDVLFEGELEVGDPAAFAALLARGLGRHRAFGFGMLLLRSPGVGTAC